ncbi:MAG TPA: YggS family pyridoxal phosphate-dependent enzyme [Anaerolineaceae bacterium]|nr:YggS family pyridoxal phosphate-dependent enzyme [Anaerolineaceae bacterium]
MAELVDIIRQRASYVQAAMLQAAASAKRPIGSTRLVVVTKLHSVETIEAAIEAGLSTFGENYPEEAASKIAQFKDRTDIHWEMIGHIQSRKANLIAHGYDLVHSVDSLKLATKIDRLREESESPQDILCEVNIASEANKGGYVVDSERNKELFLNELETISGLKRLRIIGLMGMPPLQENPETNRVHFSALRDLLVEVNGHFGWKLSELSMGTSSDFQVAIEEGATVIRIGEAILGKRK